MQGRYITHQALRALGAQERITMVTSFRPKNPLVKDESVLTTVRGISKLEDLYFGYNTYRLEMLEERIRQERKRLLTLRLAGRKIDTSSMKAFLEAQIVFLQRTNDEMVPNEDVVAGHQPEMDIPDVKMSDREDGNPSKKAKLV
jgi:hypothetical protein